VIGTLKMQHPANGFDRARDSNWISADNWTLSNTAAYIKQIRRLSKDNQNDRR
jgi:hypothetical protein